MFLGFSAKWWRFIATHALQSTAFTLVVHAGSPNLYEAVATPILYLFALEVKEALGRMKEANQPVHGLSILWKVIKQQAATRKERSEWLLAGSLGAVGCYLLSGLVWVVLSVF